MQTKYDKNSFFPYYFSNVHLSVNNKFGNLKLGIHIANIHVEESGSQIFAFGPSIYFM